MSGALSAEQSLLIETSAETAVVGTAWYLTFLIDYPNPLEVSVSLPPIPPGLRLEGSQKSTRYISSPAGPEEGGRARSGRWWTRIEYSFTCLSAGDWTIGSFTLHFPGASFQSAPLSLTVSDRERNEGQLQAWWEVYPESLRPGERAVLQLGIPEGFQEEASIAILPPRNAIIEKIGPGRWTLIALGGNISIEAQRLNLGDSSIVIPALFITVTN
jgi:hypothetical protein